MLPFSSGWTCIPRTHLCLTYQLNQVEGQTIEFKFIKEHSTSTRVALIASHAAELLAPIRLKYNMRHVDKIVVYD